MRNKSFFAFSLAVVSIFGISASLFSSREYRRAQADASSDAKSKIVPGETALDSNVDPLGVAIVDATTNTYGASFDLKFSTGEKALTDIDGYYDIIDESGALLEADAKITAMDKDTERKEYYNKLQTGEIDPIVISDCFIYAIENRGYEITIPRTIYRGEGEDDEVYYYYGVISAIGSKVLVDNEKIEELYIPNTIDEIPADAFVGNTTLQKIYCEYAEARLYTQSQ